MLLIHLPTNSGSVECTSVVRPEMDDYYPLSVICFSCTVGSTKVQFTCYSIIFRSLNMVDKYR